MPRPFKCRCIRGEFPDRYFKPQGIPLIQLEEIVLLTDELEALRLADIEQLYQEEAAKLMGVSRQTFANILRRARNKVSRALIEGKALRLKSNQTLTISQTQTE